MNARPNMTELSLTHWPMLIDGALVDQAKAAASNAPARPMA